jgi:hypothetical protein
MATLTVPQKRFIVECLACFQSPTHAAKSFKEEYGIEITRMLVQKHDPTKVSGIALSKQLRELFYETREKYRANVDDIPIANQAYRLTSLNKLHELAVSKNNAMLAAQLLEQGAKEIGGAYTNTRKLEGGKTPIGVAAITASADGMNTADLGQLYKAMMG